MTLEKLKEDILNNNLSILNNLFIFINKCNLLTNQYVDYILKLQNRNKIVVETLQETQNNSFMFEDNDMFIYKVDKLKEPFNYKDLKNTIIICDSISSDNKKIINNDNIIEIVEPEKWQVEDYFSIFLQGIDKNDLHTLISLTNNYDRLDNEFKKLYIFPKETQQDIFEKLYKDGSFDDLINLGIYDLVNAITKKDKNKILEILSKLQYIDIEPMGLLTLLLNQYKLIIDILLDKNSSDEKLKISKKQYYFLKNSFSNVYTQNSLISIYKILTNCDYLLKSGYIDYDRLVDYILIKVIELW